MQAVSTRMTDTAFLQSPEDSTWSLLPNAHGVNTNFAAPSISHLVADPTSLDFDLQLNIGPIHGTKSLIVKLKVDLNSFRIRKRPAPECDTDLRTIRAVQMPRLEKVHASDIQQAGGDAAVSSHMTQMPSQSGKDLIGLYNAFQGHMWGRDRNPRRQATKAASHGAPTPQPVRPSKTPAIASSRPPVGSDPSTGAQIPLEIQAAEKKRKPVDQMHKEGLTKRQAHRSIPPSEDMRTRRTADKQLPTPPQDINAEVEDFLKTKRIEQTNGNGENRPVRDVEFDERYVDEMKKVLEVKACARSNTTHKKQSGRILDLLRLSKVASAQEALFLSTAEAGAHLAPGMFFNGPILTVNQQALSLETPQQFLDEHYDDEVMVSIQDSSANYGNTGASVRNVKMRAIKEAFAAGPNNLPWNLLELATHQDDGLRPVFLNTEDCRLLTKLKIPGTADQARRRTYDTGFKEVEKWALLAQGGALTEPHQDSHGFSTFITLNTGCIGFGWLSHPTDEVRAAWRKDPLTFRDGNWRYIVLKPGQTVYFPAGTVHHVFRLPAAGPSLAYGGHVLRCSNIVHWVRTILEEHENQNITNEDLTDSSTGYLARVERFVLQAQRTGQEAKWGGSEAIEEFLRLKKLFDSKGKPGKAVRKGRANHRKRAPSRDSADVNAAKTAKTAKTPDTPNAPKRQPEPPESGSSTAQV